MDPLIIDDDHSIPRIKERSGKVQEHDVPASNAQGHDRMGSEEEL